MKTDHNHVSLKRVAIALFACFLWMFICGAPSLQAAAKVKRVLLLCSYHQGDEWTDRVVRGVMSVLHGPEADMVVEYLDTRRYPEPEYVKGILTMLDHQQRETPFDAIVTVDDAALDFILENRREVFRGIPVVFCGINDFQEQRIAGHQAVTGVNETIDLAATIDLALKLHPKAQHLVAMTSDYKANGKTNRDLFQRIVPSFAGRIEIRELTNLQISEASVLLGAIPPDSIVLRLSNMIDQGQGVVERMESDRLLARYSPAPVYSLWATSIGTGIVGGVMVDGYYHGEAAAGIIRRIMGGEAAASIPVILKSPNVPMFDWNALKRFHIPEDGLPPGSLLFSKPFSIYGQYREWIWGALGFMILQTWLIAKLLVARNRRIRVERELRKSEAKFQELFDDAPVGYTEYDLTGRITNINRTILDMLGYALRSELIGELVWELSLEKETARQQVLDKLDGTLPPGRNLERMYRRKDGTTFPALIEDRIVRDENGAITGIRCTVQDITERKRAEEENQVIAEIGRVIGSTLNIDEVYARLAAEVGKLIPYDRLLLNLKKNDAGEFTVAYIAGVENLRRKLGDTYPGLGSATGIVMNTRAGIIIQPDDAEEIRDLYPNLSETFKTGLRSTMSVPLISMDEVIGSLNLRSRKLHAYEGRDLRLAERVGMQIAGAIANARLFTELTHAEKSLHKSEERLKEAQRIANLGSWTWHIQTNKLELSEEMYHILGIEREGFPGDLVSVASQVIDPADLPKVELSIREAAMGHRPVAREYRIVRPDRSVHWIWVEAGDMTLDDQGKPHHLAGIVLDITGHKRAEEEKRSLEERLQRAEKMEALGQLAGGVAHDLNNVLGILTGYSELLQEGIPEGHRSRMYVDKILQSTAKGASIIDDLLTLARRGVTVSEVLNLNTVVSGFLETPVFEKMKDYHPRIIFRTQCDQNLLSIKGSPVHLEKTVMNLVSNAAESISGKGEVTIRTESRYLDKPLRGYDEVKEGDYAVLTVSDTGMGISDEDREKIFEPFYTKKTMGRSGTGLGLAIVWGTVKDHHGYIDVQTEVGEGTTFTLYFPVTREEPIAPQQKEPIERYMGKGQSVLVVDDIAEQRNVAASLLTRLGYEVQVASSGEEAVEYLRKNKADILVLDMIMAPGMDGLETYERVLEVNPKQKAIIVSGFSETARVKKAQEIGAGAYVKKPYVMEKIGVAIRDELNRSV